MKFVPNLGICISSKKNDPIIFSSISVSGQTLLKEQELIIEQMMAKASDNQGLPEVAKAAEQLREENRIKRCVILFYNYHLNRIPKFRAAEIEADNGKLKSALENIHHELEQHKAMVDELKQSVEAKDAENKVKIAHPLIQSKPFTAIGF
jgi:hypothetical protein